MKRKGKNIMSNRVSIAVWAVLLGSGSLRASEDILVASSRSNSIEHFTASGTWVSTFATTGPYAPIFMAQSPLTGEIFVTTEYASDPQLTNIILRYHADGQFDTNWDTFTVSCGAPCFSSQTQSIIFDRSGNLWVATAYGVPAGNPTYPMYPILIQEYLASDLALPNPPAQPRPIVADMIRGDQMAFNTAGDLCIAGFLDEDVKCFNTSTGTLTKDYSAEIHASNAGVAEPGGLAFDSDDRLYLTSIFTGEVLKEAEPGGPIVLLAKVVSPPNQLEGNLVLLGDKLFTTSYYNPPPTLSTPDAVYEVDTSGAVAKFIFGTAAPGLGSDHIWGAYSLIFYSTTL
jgi:hypothetical protein